MCPGGEEKEVGRLSRHPALVLCTEIDSDLVYLRPDNTQTAASGIWYALVSSTVHYICDELNVRD